MYESYDENRARLQVPPNDRAGLLGAFTTASEQDAGARQQALQAAEQRAALFITAQLALGQQTEQ